MRHFYVLVFLFSVPSLFGQFNFTYNFNSNGRRVCLVEATVNPLNPSATLHFLDHFANTSETYTIKRRPLNGTNSQFEVLAATVAATATTWTDATVSLGTVYEYQVRRTTATGDAIAHLTVPVVYDQSGYKGSMILVIDASFQVSLAPEILQLRQDLTNEGWQVLPLFVPRATTWETESAVLTVKNAIVNLYNSAPVSDKPSHLFLLGHIPIARSGQDAIAPDDHDINKGARGSDCFYADIDGVFTDTATYNPGTISQMAINLPNDYKWDQDFIPSELEMAFGRVDFANLTSYTESEEQLLRNYLNRLHQYRIVATGFDMGEKTAFRTGYDNSNDGSYRSLIPISGATNVSYYSGNLPFPQWVQNNGPFQIFMQNSQIPNLTEWQNYGMNATIFSSDQSYWGYWDEPESYNFGKIRALLAATTKCLGMIYTTTALNSFHQPAMGETMGWSCKRIMDHNATNNLLEKRVQNYDTTTFWNRTHFQYHGDPTLRLFQVVPPSSLSATSTYGEITLNWNASTETNLIGYNVYKSNSEFGIYEKLTPVPISDISYNDSDFEPTNWYQIKAIKLQTTGSGVYWNPSIGIHKNFASLAINTQNKISVKIAPNPAKNQLEIITTVVILSYEIYDLQGKLIQKNTLENYKIQISSLEKGYIF